MYKPNDRQLRATIALLTHRLRSNVSITEDGNYILDGQPLTPVAVGVLLRERAACNYPLKDCDIFACQYYAEPNEEFLEAQAHSLDMTPDKLRGYCAAIAKEIQCGLNEIENCPSVHQLTFA